MTKEEALHLAQKAGVWVASDQPIHGLERFAELVAAAEREACAKMCESLPRDANNRDCADEIRARGMAVTSSLL